MWWGESGFTTILVYAAGGSVVATSNNILTESSDNITTETMQRIATEG